MKFSRQRGGSSENFDQRRRDLLKGSAAVLGAAFLSGFHTPESKAWDYSRGLAFLRNQVPEVVRTELQNFQEKNGYAKWELDEIFEICHNDLAEALGAHVQSFMTKHPELKDTPADPIIDALADEHMWTDVANIILARKFGGSVPEKELRVSDGMVAILLTINTRAQEAKQVN